MSTNPEWRDVLHAERDSGFRDHIADLTTRGLRTLGFLGPTGVTLYMLLRVVLGADLTTGYGADGLVIWDKLVIFLITGSLIPLSSARVARKYGRWFAMAAAIILALASVGDDINANDAGFSSAWVSLFLVIAASALPFNPRQVVGLAVSMILVFVVPVDLAGSEIGGRFLQQAVFLISISLCISVISMLLYRSRLIQYRATQSAVTLADRIESLERVKSRFFTGITHDLRTPLSLVLGPVTDVLRHHEETLEDPVAAHLKIAHRNAERLRLLVDDLLDLSQLEAGHLHLNRRPRALGRLLDRWVLDLQPLAEREGVALELIVPDDSGPIVVDVDPDRMVQVVQNLVGNAIAHTPRGGRVDVTVDPIHDGHVRMRVADTGPGIPEEHLENVFDRFFRTSRDAMPTGRGLGLAIAKELTELHGGRIWAEGRSGDGSTFTVELPASADTPEEFVEEQTGPRVPTYIPGQRPASGEQRPADGLPHVLVVDDNDDMRSYLRNHLDDNYRVTEASRGDVALEIIRKDRTDMVISDVVMPGMNGFDLCRAIRADQETERIPVVLVTAQGDQQAELIGLQAGADDFLRKPFDADALVARMENLIEIRRRLAPPSVMGPTEVLVASADEEFVGRVRKVVEEHLADSNFGVDWLADEMNMASRTLQRRLRKATRLSAAGFIRMMRLGRAAQLLEAGATNVSETAYAVGFQDADHFTRIFRQTFGVLPSEYARGKRDGTPEESELPVD